MNAKRWLLVAASLLGAVHLLLLPPWMGEDEPWHFDYVKNVAEGHRPLAAWELGEIWKKEWLAEHPAGVWWATYHLADLAPEEAYATQAEIVADAESAEQRCLRPGLRGGGDGFGEIPREDLDRRRN